jgi:prepilin-type N-terminal cleavage/methylation domain-containing protein
MTKLNNKGFSLIEVVSASAVISIISISTLMLVAQSSSVAKFGEFQADLDQIHSLNVNKIRNTARLTQKLGLDLFLNTPCFSRVRNQANNCSAPGNGIVVNALVPLLFGEETVELDPRFNSNNDPIPPNPSLPGKLITYSMTYSVNCDAASCRDVRILITTGPTAAAFNRGLVGRVRRTEIVIPTMYFNNKTQISFNCSDAPQGLLTNVNYDRQATTCTVYTDAAAGCPGTLPVKKVGQPNAECIAPATQAPCPNNKGVKVVGLFGGQPICN